MPALYPLGNDIVDLRLVENETSAANHRFVARVLAPEERRAPSQVASHRGVFWAYWAAKEAAYKALRKTAPDLTFVHRRFVVEPDVPAELTDDHGSAQGVVAHGAQRVPVTWVWTDDWVHCLAGSGPNRSLYKVRTLSQCRHSESFISMKMASELPDASLAARSLAVSLLDECGIGEVQIVRQPAGRRRGPPQILQRGRALANVDVSLSHDGRYAAAAICVGPAALCRAGR